MIRVAAAEYRYDGGRERYLVRPRDPNAGFAVLPGAQWRDYDGDEAYADYAMTLDPQTEVVSPVQTAAYLPGVGFWNAAANEPQYVHGDQVGTARLLTGPSAAVRARTVMTAFGEPIQASGTGVPPVGTRYGYAGSWGYEQAECRVIDLNGPEPGGETTWCDPLAELGWLHVGHRDYDPASGRFVQRDPIGIDGGTNVYVYVGNNPIRLIDPLGLWTPLDNEYVARGFLIITGGSTPIGKFIDKVGGQIERDRTARRLAIRSCLMMAGLRLPKGMMTPGCPASTTSIWTKIPGIPPHCGRTIGRIFIPITLAEGTVASLDIGRGVIAWWYDVELDNTGRIQLFPFF